MNSDSLVLCTFQPRVVYEEVLEKSIYRLFKDDFIKHTTAVKDYKYYYRLEKYERLMKHSKLHFHENTMPIWGWYKESNGVLVSPEMYCDALSNAREQAIVDYHEMVALFLTIPRNEVYLSNFIYWDFYLFSERNDDDIQNFHKWEEDEQEWYIEKLKEAEKNFSKLDEIEGNVKVQGIFPEIRSDMIFQVLEEKRGEA